MSQAPTSDPETLSRSLGDQLLDSLGITSETPPPGDTPEPEPPAAEATQESEPTSETAPVASPEAEQRTPEAVAPSAEEWVTRVRENPNAITGVPGNLRIQVMEQVLQQERAERDAALEAERAKQDDVHRRAIDIAINRGRELEKAEEQARAFYAQVDTLAQTDAAKFTEWAAQNPQGAQWYYQWRAQGGITRIQEASPANQAIVTAAERLLDRLSAYPGLREAAAQEAIKRGLQVDAQGLSDLAEIVGEQLATIRAGKAPEATPAAKAPVAPDSGNALKDVPRPAGLSSGSTPQPTGPALSNDVSELLGMGMKPELQRARREGNR